MTHSEPAGFVSGGRLEKFTSGWALASHGRAHFFDRDELGPAVSRCRTVQQWAGQLWAPGNFKRCRTCERILYGDSAAPGSSPGASLPNQPPH